jgi:hypothetical protein
MSISRLFPTLPHPPAACGRGGEKCGFLFLFRPRIQTGASSPKYAGAVFLILLLLFSDSFSRTLFASIGSTQGYGFSSSNHWGSVTCNTSIFNGVLHLTAVDGRGTSSTSSYTIPSGFTASVTGYESFFTVSINCANGSWTVFDNCSANFCRSDFTQYCEAPYTAPTFVSCVAHFDLVSNDGSPPPLPSCSDPALIPAPQCKGGQGLSFISNIPQGTLYLNNLFGNSISEDNYGGSFSWEFSGGQAALAQTAPYPAVPNADSTDYTSQNSNGQQCSLFNITGLILEYIICPLGFADDFSSSSSAESSSSLASSSSSAPSSSSSPGISSSSEPGSNFCDDEANKDHLFCVCKRNPSDPKCVDPFSSGSGGDSGGSSSSCKIMIDGVCKDKPNDCSIMISGVCMDKPGDDCDVMIDGVCIEGGDGPGSIGGDSIGTGGGISCKLLNNCDWSKVGPQLDQIGVTKDMKKLLEDLLALYKAGYSLSGAQLAALDSLGKITSGGTRDVLGALRDLKTLLETDTVPGTGDGGDGGGWPDGACDPRVSDCTHNFNDGDTAWGLSLSGAKSILSGSSVDSSVVKNRYASILADTSKVFPSMRAAVDPFKEYISAQSSGCGTVLDFSFDIAGFHCGSNCKIDISNFGGKNIKKIISDLFTIAFGLGVLIRLLYVVRTIGQSG